MKDLNFVDQLVLFLIVGFKILSEGQWDFVDFFVLCVIVLVVFWVRKGSTRGLPFVEVRFALLSLCGVFHMIDINGKDYKLKKYFKIFVIQLAIWE